MKASKLIQFLFAGCACISKCLSEIVKHASVSVDSEGQTQARVFSNNWYADRSIRQQRGEEFFDNVTPCKNLMLTIYNTGSKEKYPSCFEPYNLDQAHCIQMILAKRANVTISCGTCKHHGYPVRLGEAAVFDFTLSWGLAPLSTQLSSVYVPGVKFGFYPLLNFLYDSGLDVRMCKRNGDMTKIGKEVKRKGGLCLEEFPPNVKEDDCVS